MKLKRRVRGFGLALMLSGQALHAQQGETDRQALSQLRAEAEKGDAKAQFELGLAIHLGKFGGPVNYADAINWYRKSADQGNARAQFQLGWCYAKGEGVAKDEVEALKWWRKAAAGGANSALNSLAWILATSRNPAIRNGSNAVAFAQKAVAATNRKVPTYLDTLAAAYAEAGQFEKAVSTQQEAIALLKPEAEEENNYRLRLKLYEGREPYRAKD